jgi:predicted Zn-dependent peptidase
VIRECRLANGLTLLTETLPDLRSATLGVWLRQGSRHEPEAISGISHFIEHLVFKGTERRTSLQISREIDAVGGQMDAFTGKETTCFYVRVLDEHVDLALDLLADIVRHARMDAEDIEKERKVIQEEISMVEDSPEELIFDMLYSSRWAGHPLGRPIQGTHHSVAAMDRKTLAGFFASSYVPNQMVISAAGRLEDEAVEQMVREAFQELPRGVSPEDGPPPVNRGGLILKEKAELEQTHVALALGGLPQAHPDRYGMMVLSNVLGGTMSSRLFQKVREERGLAYTVYSSVSSYADQGYHAIYAATRPQSTAELLAVVGEELTTLHRDPVPEQELQESKENLKGTIMLSLESSYSRMSSMARKEITFGHQFSLEDALAGIDAVTSDDLLRLSQETFRPDEATLAVVGPAAGLKVGLKDLGWL